MENTETIELSFQLSGFGKLSFDW